jgi:hypothetical protein
VEKSALGGNVRRVTRRTETRVERWGRIPWRRELEIFSRKKIQIQDSFKGSRDERRWNGGGM